MRRQRDGQKELHPLARHSAGMPCSFLSHQVGIRNPSYRENDHSGFGLRRLCRYETTSEITGSSTGTARQAEIDQHLYELGMRRMSDNARLSGIAVTQLADARQRDGRKGIDL